MNDEEYDSYPLTATPYHILMARGPLREGGKFNLICSVGRTVVINWIDPFGIKAIERYLVYF